MGDTKVCMLDSDPQGARVLSRKRRNVFDVVTLAF